MGPEPDIRSWLYADAYLRQWEPQAPVPQAPLFYREPVGLWLPLSCAIALVTNTFARYTSETSGCTTGSVDTTGANLLVVGMSQENGPGNAATLTDSKSNTWTHGTWRNATSNDPSGRLSYCVPSSVGSGHTFTLSGGGFSSVWVAAFSGAAASPFLQESAGSNGTGITRQPGSLTPSEDNCVLVTFVAGFMSAALSINSSFSITNSATFVSGSYAGGLAYLIQTTAGAANPTWSWATNTAGSTSVATMMSFKAAAAGGSAWGPLLGLANNRLVIN